MVGYHKPVDFFRGERGVAGKADRGACSGREDSRRGERGSNVLHLICKISDKVSCEWGGGEGGLRREENMEKGFLGLEAEELIFAR